MLATRTWPRPEFRYVVLCAFVLSLFICLLFVLSSRRDARFDEFAGFFFLNRIQENLSAYQEEHGELPSIEVFHKELEPTLGSGKYTYKVETDYAINNTLESAGTEYVCVVVRLERDDGERTIHMLTNRANVIQPDRFQEDMWDSKIVGYPVPYDKLISFTVTNLHLTQFPS